MFASAAMGYDFVGQLFAGKITFHADSINYYLDESDSFELDDSEVATELATGSWTTKKSPIRKYSCQPLCYFL